MVVGERLKLDVSEPESDSGYTFICIEVCTEDDEVVIVEGDLSLN